jgi:putative transposase
MGRPHRNTQDDAIYHVFNRAAGRRTLFDTERDYERFAKLLKETQTKVAIRILAYCLMPNHWHLVVWIFTGQSLSDFMHRLTTKHGRRHNEDRNMAGHGHVYQERYKCVAVENDRQLVTVLRYVESNPRTAGLVKLAEDWKWSSAFRDERRRIGPNVDTSPILRPSTWLEMLNHD